MKSSEDMGRKKPNEGGEGGKKPSEDREGWKEGEGSSEQDKKVGPKRRFNWGNPGN
jgi:hypothetical protein